MLDIWPLGRYYIYIPNGDRSNINSLLCFIEETGINWLLCHYEGTWTGNLQLLYFLMMTCKFLGKCSPELSLKAGLVNLIHVLMHAGHAQVGDATHPQLLTCMARCSIFLFVCMHKRQDASCAPVRVTDRCSVQRT